MLVIFFSAFLDPSIFLPDHRVSLVHGAVQVGGDGHVGGLGQVGEAGQGCGRVRLMVGKIVGRSAWPDFSVIFNLKFKVQWPVILSKKENLSTLFNSIQLYQTLFN